MSEIQFEKCSLQDATHVEMGGKVYEFGKEYTSEHEVLRYNSHHINVCRNIEFDTTETRWQLIHVDAFPILGIKPMKEKKPIEFEAVVKQDMPTKPRMSSKLKSTGIRA